jgi:hypothetical protein
MSERKLDLLEFAAGNMAPASARSAADQRAAEFEFIDHAYIPPGNSTF